MSFNNDIIESATKILLKDYNEIRKKPITGVHVAPLDENIFEWHCNFEIDGTAVHVILKFPNNYPAKAPSFEFERKILDKRELRRGKGKRKGQEIKTTVTKELFGKCDNIWVPSYTAKINITEATENTMYGFGMTVNCTSPNEYLTFDGYELLFKLTGKVTGALNQDIFYFIPLYLNPSHGSHIKSKFEEIVNKVTGKLNKEMIIKVFTKLMHSAVMTCHTASSDSARTTAFHGYCHFHRLFIWASKEYSLFELIETKLKSFVSDSSQRVKSVTPNLGEFLPLLSVSLLVQWEHLHITFVKENFLRNVMHYLQQMPELENVENTNVNKNRIANTFRRTKESRDIVAYHVVFLQITRPKDLTLDQIETRYDTNNGLPTEDMDAARREATSKIRGDAISGYPEWFHFIKVPCPPAPKLMELLKTSVTTALSTDGYFLPREDKDKKEIIKQRRWSREGL